MRGGLWVTVRPSILASMKRVVCSDIPASYTFILLCLRVAVQMRFPHLLRKTKIYSFPDDRMGRRLSQRFGSRSPFATDAPVERLLSIPLGPQSHCRRCPHRATRRAPGISFRTLLDLLRKTKPHKCEAP